MQGKDYVSMPKGKLRGRDLAIKFEEPELQSFFSKQSPRQFLIKLLSRRHIKRPRLAVQLPMFSVQLEESFQGAI